MTFNKTNTASIANAIAHFAETLQSEKNLTEQERWEALKQFSMELLDSVK